MDVFEVLKKLDIKYEMLEHKAIYTVEEAKQIDNMIEGQGCKNLFLTDKKGHYYLYVLMDDKKANLNELRKMLGVSKLSFGSEEELMNLLSLSKGSVTPLGIINDKNNKVILLIDEELVNKKILMHPNVNTKTVAITYSDLLIIVKYCKSKMMLVNTQ